MYADDYWTYINSSDFLPKLKHHISNCLIYPPSHISLRCLKFNKSKSDPVVAVQSPSHIWILLTPWTAARQASLSFTISQSLLKFMSIESVILFLSQPLPPTSPFAFNLSQHQGLFQWVGSSHQMAKVLELQHQSYQWIFRVGFWFDLLAVQGTLKSLLQHHSLKASILHPSAFFMVQLSHPYMSWWSCIPIWHGSQPHWVTQGPSPQGCDPWRGWI